jgi:hypothetical protein
MRRTMAVSRHDPSVAEVNLVELLEPVARDFYVSLPDPVPVWRGCEQARERGLYWTAERAVAEGFARGRRCVNKHPTLVSAEIPKRHIFGVFVHRKEHEVVLDYRRLRKLRVAQIVAEPY